VRRRRVRAQVTHSGPATVRGSRRLLIPAGFCYWRHVGLFLKINIMKETICLLLALALMGASGRTQAQNSGNFSLLNMHALGSSRPAVRAQRDFLQREGDQKGEQWYKVSDGFLAEFGEPGRTCMVYYDDKGRWSASIQNLGEKDLPVEVRRLVRSTYLDYAISWGKEIQKGEGHIYNVHIENDTSWMELLIQDDEIREWKVFSKE
jgi:hypothetical protein